jgi:hypothetical protein
MKIVFPQKEAREENKGIECTMQLYLHLFQRNEEGRKGGRQENK